MISQPLKGNALQGFLMLVRILGLIPCLQPVPLSFQQMPPSHSLPSGCASKCLFAPPGCLPAELSRMVDPPQEAILLTGEGCQPAQELSRKVSLPGKRQLKAKAPVFGQTDEPRDRLSSPVLMEKGIQEKEQTREQIMAHTTKPSPRSLWNRDLAKHQTLPPTSADLGPDPTVSLQGPCCPLGPTIPPALASPWEPCSPTVPQHPKFPHFPPSPSNLAAQLLCAGFVWGRLNVLHSG